MAVTIALSNAQRSVQVPLRRMDRVAQCAVRRLKLKGRGTLAVTFISAGRMRALNRRFLGHDWETDVLSFRYDAPRTRGPIHGGSVVGEVLVSPAYARRYARTHRLAYEEELARYVVHGILHWRGLDDATPAQQARMRREENRPLNACGLEPSNGHSHR
jgi:probable rRNA maturation factor